MEIQYMDASPVHNVEGGEKKSLNSKWNHPVRKVQKRNSKQYIV